jgi:beta-glucosidase-like glycosyl hydrolase
MLPATISRRITHGILRKQWRYEGLIVTDAIVMKALDRWSDEVVAILALGAGNDVLLMPRDARRSAEGIRRGIAEGRLSTAALAASVARLNAAIRRVRLPRGTVGTLRRVVLGPLCRSIAQKAARTLRGKARLSASERTLLFPVSLDGRTADLAPLRFALEERGVPTTTNVRDRLARPVVAVTGQVRAYQGNFRLPVAAAREAKRLLARPDSILLLLTIPGEARRFPAARNVLCAYGQLSPCQQAAAERLCSQR